MTRSKLMKEIFEVVDGAYELANKYPNTKLSSAEFGYEEQEKNEYLEKVFSLIDEIYEAQK